MKTKTTKELYQEYINKDIKNQGELLQVKGDDDYLVYNPTIPFVDNNKLIIGARVEKNNLSEVHFFEFVSGSYIKIENSPIFELEDPFVTFINGELIFGGVRLTFLKESDKLTFNYAYFQTVFYRGKSIYDLKEFAHGPKLMKDIRLIELSDKRIGVFTRPSGVDYESRIQTLMGFTIINSLEELNEEVILNAKIIDHLFADKEWGGPNQIIQLGTTKLGVIGHIAYSTFDNGYNDRHYYGMSFVFDFSDYSHSDLKIIIDRNSFPYSKEKELGLYDVIFSSGIKVLDNNKVLFFGGLSDSRIGSAIIDDPFK